MKRNNRMRFNMLPALIALCALLGMDALQAGPQFGPGLNSLEFGNFENVYRHTSNCTSIGNGPSNDCFPAGVAGAPPDHHLLNSQNAVPLQPGDIFIGIFSIRQISNPTTGITFSADNVPPTLDSMTGYFAQEVVAVSNSPTDPYDPAQAQFDHISLGVLGSSGANPGTAAGADPFGKLMPFGADATLGTADDEMFVVYVDDGASPPATPFSSLGPLSADIDIATDGMLWAALGPEVGTAAGTNSTSPPRTAGYVYSHADLSLALATFQGRGLLGLNAVRIGAAYNAGTLNSINDNQDNESTLPGGGGGFATAPSTGTCASIGLDDAAGPVPFRCTEFILTGELEANTASFLLNGDAPWVFASNDPIRIFIPEPQVNAALGDRVWHDLNGNGIQDCADTNGDNIIGNAGDTGPECGAGIPNVSVDLYEGGCTTLVNTTSTDVGGFYLFDNLAPGTYCVQFDKTTAQPELNCQFGGPEFTLLGVGDDAFDSDANSNGQADNIVLNSGDVDRTNDAGLYCQAQLGDFVWFDDDRNGIQDEVSLTGVNGVTVNLYVCDALESDGGTPGALVDSYTTGSGVNPALGAGEYLFNVAPGVYDVEFTNLPTGYVFSDRDQGANDALDSDPLPASGRTGCIIEMASGEQDLTWDAGINQPPAGLGDYVWEDKNANGIQDDGDTGIPGVMVNLYGAACSGDLLDSTTTSADGMYEFTNLDPGTYCVEFVKPDICDADIGGASQFSPANADDGNPNPDERDSDATTSGQTGDIILDPNEFDDTNDAGVYCPAKIGDRVWDDTNADPNLHANGIQDMGEPGLCNVTVELLNCGDDLVYDENVDGPAVNSMTTCSVGSDGMYMFNPLEPGNYAIRFTNPGGDFVFSPANQDDGNPNPDERDSDADPMSGVTICTTLESNENDPTWDAGLYEPRVPNIEIEKFTNGYNADLVNGGPGAMRDDDSPVPEIAPDTSEAPSIVTWTYEVRNTGNVPFLASEVEVSDDSLIVLGTSQPVLDPTSDDGGDGILSSNEAWLYTASFPALNLYTTSLMVTIKQGCNPPGGLELGRNTYENTGTVKVTAYDLERDDLSHYCNPPDIKIEKSTNGFDADEAAGVAGIDVPEIMPGEMVTWTYEVANTGGAPFTVAEVMVSDSVPGVTPVFDASSDDGDNILSPGEVWLYTASMIAPDLGDPAQTQGMTIVQGCTRIDKNNQPYTSLTYENTGRVEVPGDFDTDDSHWCNPPGEGAGTGTPGYWKNHPDAWPVDEITIGGVTYSKAEAIERMGWPDGDKTVTVFRSLVSAKLNVLLGTDASCIANTIAAADDWMATYGPIGNGVRGGSEAWRIGEPLYVLLDDYNNGLLCAPSRDTLEKSTEVDDRDGGGPPRNRGRGRGH